MRACTLFLGFALFGGMGYAVDCSSLPTQFAGSEFPSGDFFTNFQNPCYAIPLMLQANSTTDLNDTYWQLFYKVNPKYQLIIVGSFPNSRYFSLTANDDHSLISQAILDTNIVPLTSSYTNPFQPGVPYAEGQQYAVPINLGGTPGTLETGCQMNGYNVDVNSLDGSLRHQGLNWNTDSGFLTGNVPFHVVDTPQHGDPARAGYLMIRSYVDINADDPRTVPSVIVRDVATGCAYPAAYALETLQVVATSASTAWLDQNQYNAHFSYDEYLPSLCYGTDPRNALIWSRDGQMVKYPNPYGVYVMTNTPPNLPATLASAGEVMRIRLRIPNVPPTPCTNGCSRSGNEQMRYMGLSFYPSSNSAITTLASLGDYQFTKDANGYATLIVGTGAAIPSWITPANGYTFVDLTTYPAYQSLNSIQIRNILASDTFSCASKYVPYKTSVWTPAGSMMGDYLPVVDYPLAATLPLVAAELVGPSSCGVLPVGVPDTSPGCGLLPSNPMTVAPVMAPSPGQIPLAVQPSPPLTISGSGFGFLPNGLPFTGNSSYLQITDYTQNWSAGYTGNQCTVTVVKWADNRIELVANVNTNGLCPLAAGDQVGISVWNPQTMAGPGATTLTVAPAPVPGFALGSSTVFVGSAAGSGTVLLTAIGPWTASSNAAWLQADTLSGVGNTIVKYDFSANPNAKSRTNTLTIAGMPFTVTQAAVNSVPATSMTPLVSSGLNGPQGVAVDSQGNVYIADTGNNAIKKWSPGTNSVTTLVSSGLNHPTGVAADGLGNLYIADGGNHAIEEWSPANPQLTTLASGLGNPYGVTVSTQGSVYFTDSGNNAIDQWSAGGAGWTTVAGSGLSNPTGLAVNLAGNVFFSNTGANAIDEWNTATQQMTTAVSSGINAPSGVAVDVWGNVYFSDTGHQAIKQWNGAIAQVTTLVSSGLSRPAGVAVDAQGNLYVADQIDNSIDEFSFAYLSLSATSLNEGAQAGTDSVTAQILPANTALTVSSNQPWLTISSVAGGVIAYAFQANNSGATRIATITVLGQPVTVTQSGLAPATITKSGGNGQSAPTGGTYPLPLTVTVKDINGVAVQGAAVTFTANVVASGASGTLSSTPPMPILTDQNGKAVSPALTANSVEGQFSVTASVDELSVNFYLTNQVYALGASSVTVGSAKGNGSVFLAASAPWTATSNASWLQVSAGSASGTGNALIQFSYAANSSPGPQTGTLTIAGLTFTVTQTSANYVPVYPVTTLVATGLSQPQGVAVDGLGDVYIADTGNDAIEEWIPSTQQFTTLPTNGLSSPTGVAVDIFGNIYIADGGNYAIRQWNAGALQALALVAELTNPYGVAVDTLGNLYFSDAGNNALDEWSPSTKQVTSLAAGSGLSHPLGLAVDGLGNVYYANAGSNAIEEWNISSQQAVALVSSGINSPAGVALDGQGNVYFSDTGNNSLKQWNAASGQVVTMVSSGLSRPAGVAVDTLGNVYVADQNNNAIKEVAFAYLSLSATNMNETAAAGTGSVTAMVLPVSTPWAATSDQPWLIITAVTGGTVGFAYQNNILGTSRMAHITILGQQVTVTQSGDPVANLTKSAGDGQSVPIGQPFPAALQVTVTDSIGNPIPGVPVLFSVTAGSNGAGGTFSLTPPMPVLSDQNGNAIAPALTANYIGGPFTVSASAGTLSVDFTLTNLLFAFATPATAVSSAAGAGSVFLIAAGSWTVTSNAPWLTVAPGSRRGTGSAVIDFNYTANAGVNPQIGTLTVSGSTFTIAQAGSNFTLASQIMALVSSGLKAPRGVAVDGQGNVYIADSVNNAIKEWNATTNQVSSLVSSGLSNPTGLAVDAYGNLYIADNKNNAIKEWIAATQQVTTLVSTGLKAPVGVAVDSQGNVYFSDSGNNVLKEWVAASGAVKKLCVGLNDPQGVAVDALGNVYFADGKNNAVKEWNAGTKVITVLVSSGLNNPYGVAVDGEGNVYIADSGNNAVKEWNAATQQVAALNPVGLKAPDGVAVDVQGNVYIADTGDYAVRKLMQAYFFLSATSLNEKAKAGTDFVNYQVLPANAPVIATCNQKWLTITSTGNGTITFSFKANTATSSRRAAIMVWGQQVTVTQSGVNP
jgi:streptogramin lyase